MTLVDVGRQFEEALERTGRFFMGDAPVHRAMDELIRNLEEQAIPYAILGAMALNAYGLERATVDIDVLLTSEGLQRLKQAVLGRGYVEKFPGSRGLRDTRHGVAIDVVLAGDFPGDGRPKPVAFPDPAAHAVIQGRARLLPLPKLVELKLASGMTAPHRIQDLADVLRLIQVRGLPEDFASQLDAYVREKYREIWRAAQTRDPE
jgi:hypothetical protein